MRAALLLTLLATPALVTTALAAGPQQFWNLTSRTLTSLTLAPAGTDAFGPNQCLNDKDHEVDHDERLKLVGVAAGTYDVRTTDAKGRMCMARGVVLKGEGKVAFSLSDADLTDCQ